MDKKSDLITFQTTCKKCGRQMRVFHDKEKMYPKCVYCGGELNISSIIQRDITNKIQKYKTESALYEFERNCPICNRVIGTSGKIGEERPCSYCTCNFKLINTGALIPVSFGLGKPKKGLTEIISVDNLTLEQGLNIIHRIEVLTQKYSSSDFANLLQLMGTTTEKLIYLNQFDGDYVNLIMQNLVPMLNVEIKVEDNTFIFPTSASYSGELFGLIVDPSSIPMLRKDPEGFILMTIPVNSAYELKYIDRSQVAIVFAKQENLPVKAKSKTFIALIEGVMLNDVNSTKAQFFLRFDDKRESMNLNLSDDGKRYFQSLFMDYGLLYFLCKLMYGKWFPAYALRYLHADALQRIYTLKMGEEIPEVVLAKINKILLNFQV